MHFVCIFFTLLIFHAQNCPTLQEKNHAFQPKLSNAHVWKRRRSYNWCPSSLRSTVTRTFTTAVSSNRDFDELELLYS